MVKDIGGILRTELKEILKEQDFKQIFLVTSGTSFVTSGAKEMCDEVLSDLNVTQFSDFSPNPNSEDIKKGIVLFNENNVDVVIAIGGGSVIDMAKSIRSLASHGDNLEVYITGKKSLHENNVPLVAIPTTSGTGSEATHFSAVYIGREKYSLAHPLMLPEFVILDPTLTYSLPQHIIASTGIDTLSQAIESYWSNNSTRESKKYAKEAMKIAIKNLKYAHEGSKGAKDEMLKAAHLSGKAINISKTTVSHAMSYPFTSYFNVPHGHAVGLTLPRILLYNSEVGEGDVTDARGVGYVKQVIREICLYLGVKGPIEAVSLLENIAQTIGLEVHISKLGVEEKDFDIILNNISEERVGNNPRKFTKEAARSILEQIL